MWWGWGSRSKTIQNWWSWRTSSQGSPFSLIGFAALFAACWFLWKQGYGVLALIILIAGVPALAWLDWALWDAQLKPWAGRSSMAVNDPVYDIKGDLDPDDVEENPAADPLYDTDSDFTAAPTESGPDPLVDPLVQAPHDEEETPPASS